MRFKKKGEKRVIIILGPPGAGKGTQAILLAELLRAFHFETSAIIEKEINQRKENEFVVINKKKYSFKEQKKLWLEGKLVDPQFVVFFVLKKVKELIQEGKSIIFSGSPRTVYEAKRLIPLLKKNYLKENIRVIFFLLKEKDSIFRNSHRRICQLFRHPILFSLETAKLKKCPLDGSLLLKRELDKPEVIKKRLKEYQERTLPLIDYFKKQGIKIFEIDASPSPAEIFEKIVKKLSLK
ncbi:MAG: adenylate kinase family protein [Minisyncoccales bacterium]